MKSVNRYPNWIIKSIITTWHSYWSMKQKYQRNNQLNNPFSISKLITGAPPPKPKHLNAVSWSHHPKWQLHLYKSKHQCYHIIDHELHLNIQMLLDIVQLPLQVSFFICIAAAALPRVPFEASSIPAKLKQVSFFICKWASGYSLVTVASELLYLHRSGSSPRVPFEASSIPAKLK